MRRLLDLLEFAWGLEATDVKGLSGGNINATYRVGETHILQWLNPIFDPAVNGDIAALSPVLLSHGVTVPQLCRTKDGGLWTDGEKCGVRSGVWRLMNRLPGRTLMALENVEQLRSLFSTIARFHSAFLESRYEFGQTRGFAHDFSRHWKAFEGAFNLQKKHRVWPQVSRIRDEVEYLLRFVRPEETLRTGTRRIIHGDPKCANFLFEGNEVSGVIDLDTMARSYVTCEIGDAVRSCCNAHSENDAPEFNAEYAREAVGLYEELSPFLTREERGKLRDSAPCIALELGIRFARDALCEDYFGFDPAIGHAEHSLIRAKNQVELAAQMLAGREV